MGLISPRGYKRLIHRECGGRLGWAKDEVRAAAFLRASDLLDNEAMPLLPDALLRCRCDRCSEVIFNPALMAFFDD